MFNRVFKSFTRSDPHVPATYDPKLHYNCFVESLPGEIRQAVYRELRSRDHLRVSYRLPDGRLQLSVLDLNVALEALSAVDKHQHAAYKVTIPRLIKLMMKRPDVELAFVRKTGEEMHHVETHRLSQLVLASDQPLRKGISHHERREYQRAIDFYDEAIKREPLDLRAWNNKIVALSELGAHQEAIRVAGEILVAHPDVAFLWNAKAYVLAQIGKQFEAGECLSQATSLDSRILDRYEVADWFETIRNDAVQAGRNPDIDAEFWFGKFTEYMQSAQEYDNMGQKDNAGEHVGKALTCLQTAAKIAPDYCVLSDSFTMALLPPDMAVAFEQLVKGAKVEPLRDFYLALETANAGSSGHK